jgi:hypothetical protein
MLAIAIKKTERVVRIFDKSWLVTKAPVFEDTSFKTINSIIVVKIEKTEKTIKIYIRAFSVFSWVVFLNRLDM